MNNITTEAIHVSRQLHIPLWDAMDHLNEQSDRTLFLPCSQAAWDRLVQMFGREQVHKTLLRLGSREAARAYLLREGRRA